MKAPTSIEIFINRFAFNKDADIQYLLHGLTETRPYVEQLRTNLTNLIKSQRIYKKNLTTIKIKTDKNAKKFTESFNNLEVDFLKMVDVLKDTHHFFINIFRIDIFTKKKYSYEKMYDEYSDMNSNFTELVQQIDFNRDERFILNTFNRMRNIIIHAPSGIIVGYLTENVLEEFKRVVNSTIGIANNILIRNLDSIKGIAKIQQEEIEREDNLGIESAKDYAKKHNLTINELLEVLKKSEHDFVVEIHQDMKLDAYTKTAIAPLIEEDAMKKKKEKEEAEQLENMNKLYNSDSFLVIDFDYVLNLFSMDINRTYNHIYELYENLKANKLSIISESKSKDILQAINELNFSTNNKKNVINSCHELIDYISNSNSSIIAYVDDKIQKCLDDSNKCKYIIVHKNDCNLNIDSIKWNSIVIKNSDVLKIIQTKNVQ